MLTTSLVTWTVCPACQSPLAIWQDIDGLGDAVHVLQGENNLGKFKFITYFRSTCPQNY